MNRYSKTIKIGFINDLHGRGNNPIARMDNYPEAILKKVEYILDNNDIIVFTGDVLNTYITNIQFINKLLLLLVKAQVNNKVIKIIMGNHDIVGRSYDSYLETALGTLLIGRNWFLNEAYAPMGFEIVPFTFDEKGTIIYAMTDEEYDIDYENTVRILVGHSYFEHPEFHDKWNIDRTALQGYHYCILGHDHQKYEPFIEEWHRKGVSSYCTLLRTGSISRQTIDDKDWKIQYPQIVLNFKDENTVIDHHYEVKDIPYTPKEEAFKLEDTNNKELQKHKKNIEKMIELLQVEKTKETLSVYNVLSEIKCPQKYTNIIREVLNG